MGEWPIERVSMMEWLILSECGLYYDFLCQVRSGQRPDASRQTFFMLLELDQLLLLYEYRSERKIWKVPREEQQ